MRRAQLRHAVLQATFSEGSASGLSAHRLAANISIGSSLSQNTHFNSVRPLELGIGTIRFPQCKQRVTGSMGVLLYGSHVPKLNVHCRGELKAIDRVMYAYTMIANLTPGEVQATRQRLEAHLAGMDADEKALAVEGMRFLRGPQRVARRRTMEKAL